MSDDKCTMLYRAARGAGYRYYDSENDELHVTKFHQVNGWNPLGNDGDAFRLMIRCGMTLFQTDGWQKEYTVAVSSREIHLTGVDWDEDAFNDDWNAMIRYAIVEHAAALGDLRDA